MVNLSNVTPFNLSNSGMPHSNSGGSLSRTRHATRSHSPQPSIANSDSSNSIRPSSSLLLHPGDADARRVRLVKPASKLRRGRSQTIKSSSSSVHGSNPSSPPNPVLSESFNQIKASDVTTTITAAEDGAVSPQLAIMTVPTMKQEPEYVVEGISELTGGWGD